MYYAYLYVFLSKVSADPVVSRSTFLHACCCAYTRRRRSVAIIAEVLTYTIIRIIVYVIQHIQYTYKCV